MLKQYGPIFCTLLSNAFRVSRGSLTTVDKTYAQVYTVDWVVSALEWLDDWPVGLKLNTPLSRFFRVGFSTIIEAWGGESIHSGQSHLLMISGCSTAIASLSICCSPHHFFEWLWWIYPLPVHSARYTGSPHAPPPSLLWNHLSPGEMAVK